MSLQHVGESLSIVHAAYTLILRVHTRGGRFVSDLGAEVTPLVRFVRAACQHLGAR